MSQSVFAPGLTLMLECLGELQRMTRKQRREFMDFLIKRVSLENARRVRACRSVYLWNQGYRR